jgi:hypothetical protein
MILLESLLDHALSTINLAVQIQGRSMFGIEHVQSYVHFIAKILKLTYLN